MPVDTPLHKHAYKGEVGECEDLLEKGADVNSKGAGKRTPLHRAVGEDNDQIVRLLLRYGADVNIQDGAGRTPLHWAAVSGATSSAKILFLEYHANINEVTKSGYTPLIIAAENGKTEMVRLLIEWGADTTIQENTSKQTAYDISRKKKHKDIMVLLQPASTGGCCIIQ